MTELGVSVPLIRSLEFERGITRQACKGITDPSRLIEHAEHRAQTLHGEYVVDPMHVRQGLDRRREVREELVDARNHLRRQAATAPLLVLDNLHHINLRNPRPIASKRDPTLIRRPRRMRMTPLRTINSIRRRLHPTQLIPRPRKILGQTDGRRQSAHRPRAVDPR